MINLTLPPTRYPYALGYHIPTQRLCRILHPALNDGRIEENCVLVKEYREKGERFKRDPYTPSGTLEPKYWSIERAIWLNHLCSIGLGQW